MDAAGSSAPTASSEAKASRAQADGLPRRMNRYECGSMVPRHDLCRPACRRTGCSTGRRAVNHQADADIAFGHADFVAHDRRKIRVRRHRRRLRRRPHPPRRAGCGGRRTGGIASGNRYFAGCELRGRDTADRSRSAAAVSAATKAKVTRPTEGHRASPSARPSTRGVRRCVSSLGALLSAYSARTAPADSSGYLNRFFVLQQRRQRYARLCPLPTSRDSAVRKPQPIDRSSTGTLAHVQRLRLQLRADTSSARKA